MRQHRSLTIVRIKFGRFALTYHVQLNQFGLNVAMAGAWVIYDLSEKRGRKGFLIYLLGGRVGVYEAPTHVSGRACPPPPPPPPPPPSLSSSSHYPPSSSILLLIYIVSSSSPAGRLNRKWAFRCGRPEMDENLHSLFSYFSFLSKNISGVLQ